MQNGTTAIISRNGSHPEPVAVEEHDLLWDGLPPATKVKLGEPLDEGLVSHRKGRGGRTFGLPRGGAPPSTRPTASSGTAAGVTSSPVPSSCARARASTRRRARRATCAPTPPPFA